MKNLGKILNHLSNVFTKDTTSNLGKLLGAVGNQLDQLDPTIEDLNPTDPNQLPRVTLAHQFAVSTSVGVSLDKHGVDWGVPRRFNEKDDAYRARILAMLPSSRTGPTVAAISSIVKNFSGSDPILIEYGPDSFYMGVTPMGSFVFNDESPFTFQVQVQGDKTYSKSDLEDAVNRAKPVRSTALFVHSTGGK